MGAQSADSVHKGVLRPSSMHTMLIRATLQPLTTARELNRVHEWRAAKVDHWPTNLGLQSLQNCVLRGHALV